MRAGGMTHRAIGEALGAPRSTVEAWVAGRRRTVAPVRVIVTRIVSPQSPTTGANAPGSQRFTADSTVNPTPNTP